MREQTNAWFSELVGQYERLVYTVCFQLVRNPHAAEDLTQEAFLAAYTHRQSCPTGYERQWLCRIAANKAKDYLQSAYVRHTVLAAGEELPLLSPSPPPEELALVRSGVSEIRRRIETLREPYRQVCRLYFLEEKKPEEIALALGRPVKTVHTQIARARQILRSQLERREDDGTVS